MSLITCVECGKKRGGNSEKRLSSYENIGLLIIPREILGIGSCTSNAATRVFS